MSSELILYDKDDTLHSDGVLTPDIESHLVDQLGRGRRLAVVTNGGEMGKTPIQSLLRYFNAGYFGKEFFQEPQLKGSGWQHPRLSNGGRFSKDLRLVRHTLAVVNSLPRTLMVGNPGDSSCLESDSEVVLFTVLPTDSLWVQRGTVQMVVDELFADHRPPYEIYDEWFSSAQAPTSGRDPWGHTCETRRFTIKGARLELTRSNIQTRILKEILV